MGITADTSTAKPFCILTNIQTYLNHYGIHFKESWLGGLLGYHGFYFTLKPVKYENVRGSGIDFMEIFKYFKSILKNPLKLVEPVDVNDFMKLVESHTKSGSPLFVWVDHYYAKFSVYYGKAHHRGLVVIENVSGNVVDIFYHKSERLSLDEFIELINNSGKITMFYNPQETIELLNNEAKTMAAGLLKSYDNLTTLKETKDEFYGINGIGKFAEYYSKNIDSKIFYSHFYEMTRASGLSDIRANIVELCEDISIKWPEVDTSKCAEVYKILIKKWNLVANLTYKLSTEYDSDLHSRIIQRIKDVAVLEAEGAAVLKSVAESLYNLN